MQTHIQHVTEEDSLQKSNRIDFSNFNYDYNCGKGPTCCSNEFL